MIRPMALRANLDNARGDVENQVKWARAVVDLWATADPPLQPVIETMKKLATRTQSK